MEFLAKALGMIVIFIIICVVGALPTMWLWNWLMPVIFGLKTITWFQALGVNVLSTLLFQHGGSK